MTPAWIDFHTHLTHKDTEPSPAELSRAAACAAYHGIQRLVLLGNITAVGGPEPTMAAIRQINSGTLTAVQRYPHLYIGFCYLNPAHPVSFITEEINRCVVDGGMRGIKLWIAVKADDKRLDPIMDQAQRHGLTVLHHAWYKRTGNRGEESTPQEIAALGRRWPDVAIVMAHLAGCRERGVQDIAPYPNIHMDTSGGQGEAGLVDYAIRHLGIHRIVYGSDWPLRDFGVQLARCRSARTGAYHRWLMMAGNAQRLLGLDGDPA